MKKAGKGVCAYPKNNHQKNAEKLRSSFIQSCFRYTKISTSFRTLGFYWKVVAIRRGAIGRELRIGQGNNYSMIRMMMYNDSNSMNSDFF